jgi:hypothetical protein
MFLLTCFISIYSIPWGINYLRVPGIPEIIRIVPSSSWTSHTTFLIFFASTSAKSVFSLPGVFHFLFRTVSKEGVPCTQHPTLLPGIQIFPTRP